MTKSTKKQLMAIASFACVLHCIIAPFLVISAPMIGHLFDNMLVEIFVLIFSISCGIAIVYNGYCNHKKKHSMILFFIGALFWGINSLIEEIAHTEVHAPLLIIGTILVLLAYRINHNHKKNCCSLEDHH